jgi:hypothetical protein
MSDIKRYDVGGMICDCGIDDLQSENGKFLRITDLIGNELCETKEGEECRFYSEMESNSGYNYHSCGMSREWVRTHTNLDCPFKDLK